MATPISGSLGRNTSYANTATGLNDFTNEWLVAADNQSINITGSSTSTFNNFNSTTGANLSLLNFSTAPDQNLNNLALTNLNQPGNDTFGSVLGIGVADSYDGWYNDPGKIRAEINYNPNNGESQLLKFKWADNQSVTNAFIDLSTFSPIVDEQYGTERGFVQAFKNGTPVSITGVRYLNENTVAGTQTSIQNTASGVIFTADKLNTGLGDYKFKVFGDFNELRFTALPYLEGTTYTPTGPDYRGGTVFTDSSDYLVQQIKYVGTEEPIGTLQFSSPIFSVNENGTPIAQVTVTRTGGSFGAVSATVNLSNGTATGGSQPFASGTDYNNAAQVVNFANGEISKTVVIPINDDSLIESTETVNLSLTNPTGGATIGTQNTATLNILDNDSSIQFSNPQYAVNEDGTPVLAVTVTRTGNTTNAASATVNLTNGTATGGSQPFASGTDYNNAAQVVNFASGETSKTVVIPINDDLLIEKDETVNLSLSNPTGGATLGTQNTATLTILDNDSVPVVMVAALDPTAGEPGRNEGTGTFQFARTGGNINQALTARYTITGTATAGTDYTALSGIVNFAAGQSVSGPVTLTALDDTANEPLESVVVKVAEGLGYQVGSADTATVTITDNDPLTGSGSGPVLRYDSGGNYLSSYGNITSAVGAATANDIIVVQAGTYSEAGTVFIDKALTIRGPNAGVSPASASGTTEAVVQGAANQPVFSILPGVGNVTIEGLKIAMNNANGVAMQGDGSNAVIRQNTFTGIGPFNNGIVYMDTGNTASSSSAQVIDNLMRDVTTSGSSTTSGVQVIRFNTVRVTDNEIAGLSGPGVAADSMTNGLIAANKVSNVGEQGIQVAGRNGTIDNNDITNANTVNGADRGGIRVRDGYTSLGTVDVLSNVVTNSYNGIAIRDNTGATGTINVHYNNLIGNRNAGFYHGGTGAVNGTNNWWDDAAGAVVGGTGPNAIAGTGNALVSHNPSAVNPF